jgi:aryl-alcohol dehydrogenase-like predicted oxidoreductase
METRFLGRTGLQVSELCLGTMTFGAGTDEPTAHRILDAFVDAGGTFIDTANGYSQGMAEEMIGRWLQTRDRDDLVIATKVYGEARPEEPVRGTGRKHVLAEVEASLRRLQTDFVDLYQAHLFGDATPIEETLSTFDSLVTAGKVRFIGASNYTGWQLQKSIDVSRQHGWEPFVSLQPLYNLLDRDAELELLPVCRNEGAGVIAWSPLAGGLLSGKYRRDMDTPPRGVRVDAEEWARRSTSRTWQVIDVVREVAIEVGRTAAQVALRWILQQPTVTGPIIGARTAEQLADNLGATGWTLSEDDLHRLIRASEFDLPYPYALQRFRSSSADRCQRGDQSARSRWRRPRALDADQHRRAGGEGRIVQGHDLARLLASFPPDHHWLAAPAERCGRTGEFDHQPIEEDPVTAATSATVICRRYAALPAERSTI